MPYCRQSEGDGVGGGCRKLNPQSPRASSSATFPLCLSPSVLRNSGLTRCGNGEAPSPSAGIVRLFHSVYNKVSGPIMAAPMPRLQDLSSRLFPGLGPSLPPMATSLALMPFLQRGSASNCDHTP